MPITQLSAQALRVLEENRRLRIHSVFSSAVNLRAGDRLLACTSVAISAPHGIEMTSGDLAGLQRLHRAAPDAALDWSPSERSITSRSRRLTIRAMPGVTVFDATLPVVSSRGDALVEDLIGHLVRVQARTGLGGEWHGLVTDRRLRSAFAALREGRVDAAVRYWLGRGPGLTPSGDDVLVGMLAALYFVGAVGPSQWAALADPLERAAQPRTTDISLEYLRYASRGMVIGALRELLVALGRSELGGAVAAVDRLRRYGHTSGMDCLLGTLAALHHLGGPVPCSVS